MARYWPTTVAGIAQIYATVADSDHLLHFCDFCSAAETLLPRLPRGERSISLLLRLHYAPYDVVHGGVFCFLRLLDKVVDAASPVFRRFICLCRVFQIQLYQKSASSHDLDIVELRGCASACGAIDSFHSSIQIIMSTHQNITVEQAIKVLTDAGAVFSAPTGKHLCLKAVAARLDCSVGYVRDHLGEFPNAWRMPGGELRIPERDVENLAKRCKLPGKTV